MPSEIRLWQVQRDGLQPVSRAKLDLEANIQKWLAQDISLLAPDLLLIGEQVEPVPAVGRAVGGPELEWRAGPRGGRQWQRRARPGRVDATRRAERRREVQKRRHQRRWITRSHGICSRHREDYSSDGSEL